MFFFTVSHFGDGRRSSPAAPGTPLPSLDYQKPDVEVRPAEQTSSAHAEGRQTEAAQLLGTEGRVFLENLQRTSDGPAAGQGGRWRESITA